ncbi:hypothetical protein PR048_029392 [Dryococelus australis]|uniref:Uncharacterized protein n=1 Tax=Dryococelus australis TaxID=614101 RepID=A0ABQ9GFN9_9NEOP|nr:hypothetical protein PR048_029392 [Dryococelus australis]
MLTESLMPMAKVELRGLLLAKLEDFSSDKDKKLCMLLKSIGMDNKTLLRNLCVPKKLGELMYAEAVTMIRNHMQPTLNYIAERFKFDKCAQQPDESISEFISALKGLSVHCDFRNTLLEWLRGKLVSCVKYLIISVKNYWRKKISLIIMP